MIHHTDLSGISYEEPRAYTIENIAFHEPVSRRIREQKKGKAILLKAKNFLENNCVTQKSETEWEIKPIKDYNKRTHRIRLTPDGFVCDCQGFRNKFDIFEEGKSDIIPICSHVLAVKQFCFIEEKNKLKRGEE